MLQNTPVYQVVLLAIAYGITSIVGVGGNVLVIVVIVARSSMHTLANYFLINLAVADVIIGCLSVPFQFQAALLQKWILPDILCRVVPFTSSVSMNVNIYTLVVNAMERYCVITSCKCSRLQNRSALILFMIIWLISILCSVPYLFYSVKVENITLVDDIIQVRRCLCPADSFFLKTFPSIMLLLNYVIPVSVISYAYFCIGMCIIRSNVPSQSLYTIQFKRQQKRRLKVVKTFLIIVVVFCVCWFPIQLYNFLNVYYPRVNDYKYIIQLFLLANWFAMSNSCYNPFIYSFCNKRFRHEVRELLLAVNDNMKSANRPLGRLRHSKTNIRKKSQCKLSSESTPWSSTKLGQEYRQNVHSRWYRHLLVCSSYTR